ncbi:hypothetical protein ORV05_23030 [Amycolatopsis cynarae]|uniref:DUF3592 domain-containing protein n=1 Tax=Amycolatopsis cynarae TaxID=2995223 RepID=A0ABY7AV49_9PSEU|nr:hypothetical protein [Amycolatopsis sp. HUAS 11-8]WAL63855.1 hypothetical protein ORV05_23030 [Amycolatopsis sp. HUAS 11-8]
MVDHGRDDDVRRHRRARNASFALCLVLALAGLLWTSLVIVALITGSDPPSVTLFSVSAVVVGTLAVLAVKAGIHAVRRNRELQRRRRTLAAAAAAGKTAPPPAAWVPPGPGETGAGDVDLTAGLRRLRLRVWRGTGVFAVFVALLGGAVAQEVRLSHDADDLLHHGVWVTGSVTDVSWPSRGEWSIKVDYPVRGEPRTAKIVLDTKRPFQLYQDVVVVYDATDPARVRTPEDENTDKGQLSLFVAPLLVGLGGTPFSGLYAMGWFRRYRAARRTGWHSAGVFVGADGRTLTATYPGGSEIQLRHATTYALDAVSANGKQQGWVAGERSAMTVLFAHGDRPVELVPVRAEGPLAYPLVPLRRRRPRRRR